MRDDMSPVKFVATWAGVIGCCLIFWAVVVAWVLQ